MSKIILNKILVEISNYFLNTTDTLYQGGVYSEQCQKKSMKTKRKL